MTRKIAMAFIAGVVLGGTATEAFNVYRLSLVSHRESQSFQERLNCKAVADAHVKENTNIRDDGVTGTSMMLEKVDYSPARNSCVAELQTVYSTPRGATGFDSVEDLLSGKTLFSVSIADKNFIPFQQMFLPQVWDYVMNNASEPEALEKEWTLIESKNPPKATMSPSFIAEPKEWQTLPSRVARP